MNRWSLFFIIGLLAIPQVGIDLYLPSAPSMVIALHTSATLVQLSLAIYVVGMGVSQLIYGPVSDSIGRKPVILFGTLVFIVGSAVCCFTTTIDVFLLGRLIQGVGIGYGSAVSRAILRDLCHDKKRMAKIVSYQSMIFSMVPLFAPIFGGYIEHYLYWRANFLILFGIGVLLFVLVLFQFSETRAPADRIPLHFGKVVQGYFSVIKDFSIFIYVLVIMLQFSATLAVVQLSPFIFQDQLGYSPAAYGWFIFVVGLARFVGAFINRSIIQRLPLDRIIVGSLLLGFLTMVLMNALALQWFNAWVIVIPILLMRFSGGLSYANCIAQVMHKYPQNAGSVSALIGAMAMVGGSVISGVIAHLPHYKQISLSGSLGVLLLISLALFSSVLFFKRKRANAVF